MMTAHAKPTARIDAARLWDRLTELAHIGGTAAGGVDRQALTQSEIDAWRLVIGWGRDAGLEASTDPAGNLFLTLPGIDPLAPPLLLGSHLDTQPKGGRFDGAAGVMAALEVVVSLAANGLKPSCDVIVVAWMNEEGCRFAPGMMGSEAFAAVRPLEIIRSVQDADGVSVGEALDRLQASFPGLLKRHLGFKPCAYLELHIEQGTILEHSQKTIGIVTGIQGKKTFRVTIQGEEGHAGTVPMADRRDAVARFAAIAATLGPELCGQDEAVKFTIGRIAVSPNAPSVVPARLVFSADLRHPESQCLDRLGARFTEICLQLAAPCSAAIEPLVDAAPNAFDIQLRALIAQAAERRGYPAMSILSAAGHDSRNLAAVCPSAMIFIPCRGGISHAEAEWAEPEHLTAGASVLADVVHALLVAAPPGS